jgi:galactokinase
MDQVACANGGIVAIDFAEAGKPVIEPVAFDISGAGYALCITDTGGNHADLTDDYAAVPAEMKAVARVLGADLLRRTSKEALLANIEKVRSECGDRAVLRALHFFNENERVAKQKAALLSGNVEGFFSYVIESGRSSFCYLQNVYTTKNVSEQGLSLALCLAEGYMSGKKGAFRVHGGGFAGTVQAFVALSDVEGFRALMDSAFGDGKCMVLRVRQQGAVKVID